MSEKTEKPTPKKLRDARKKGQIAKSKEISTCAVIVGLFAYFCFFFDTYLERIKYLVHSPTQFFDKPFDEALINIAKIGAQEFVLLTLPFAFTAMVITVLSYLMQFGFLIAFEPIKPDIQKISPISGIKRIFSMSNLLELAKSIVKIILVSTIFYLYIKSSISDLIHIYQGSPQSALDLLGVILKKIAIAISALFIVVAIIDHFFQKHLHIKKLKMSKDDVKREYKDREGDPHVKGQRRQLQIEMSQDDMAAKIKEATVVLIRKKEKAVVLRYEMGETPLPIVSLKGKAIIADKILALAKKHNIPVYPEPALTQDLFEGCQQDNYISTEFIEPVAGILRKVMGLDGQNTANAA